MSIEIYFDKVFQRNINLWIWKFKVYTSFPEKTFKNIVLNKKQKKRKNVLFTIIVIINHIQFTFFWLLLFHCSWY